MMNAKHVSKIKMLDLRTQLCFFDIPVNKCGIFIEAEQ